MSLFARHFSKSLGRMAIIGMVHVHALPGTPLGTLSVQQLVDKACHEAHIYCKHGLDGVCIENMFDIPYLPPGKIGPEVTAVMTRVAAEVRRLCPSSMPVGVQILAAQNCEALAVALAAKLQFVRVEGFVFGHIADEGPINGCAGMLLRYRKQIGIENKVAIIADIKKKHSSHAITADLDELDIARAAQFFLADGVIVTGKETGHSPQPAQVATLKRALKSVPSVPVIVGSGVDANNVNDFAQAGADAAIIGSHFKKQNNWQNELCEQRLANFVKVYQNVSTTSK